MIPHYYVAKLHNCSVKKIKKIINIYNSLSIVDIMTAISIDLGKFNGNLRGLNAEALEFVLDVFFHIQNIKINPNFSLLLCTLRDVYNISIVHEGAVLA